MSDAHNEHESAIKTPNQLIVAVLAAFIVPIVCIVLLVQFVTTDKLTGAGTDSKDPNIIAARIKPVADDGFTLKDVNAPKVLQTGEAVYKQICAACHATGAANSPKVGDNAGWAARIAQGYETLLKHAVEGFKGMPAKGGNADLDEVEVARAIVFMANQSGASFKEPEVKAAAPAAAASAAASEATSAAASVPAASAPAASAPGAAEPAKLAADAGKKVYEASCQMCHGAGVAGAPKFGDKAAWAERIKQGSATLHEHALKGFQGKSGMMPPRGTSSASDDEIKAAVDYMAAAAK